jgi:hypothetical protein
MNRLSGEFFDLTITSVNNDFGYEKTKYSLMHGISTPLGKYIEELRSIISQGANLKSDKRSARLDFLEQFEGDAFFEQYFQDMMCFLNGGYHLPRGQETFSNNKIVITIAGGNIVTIFAKLVKDLLTYAKSGGGTNLSTFNYNYVQHYTSQVQTGLDNFGGLSRWNSILSLLSRNRGYLLERFSDFDYNLLPNKPNHPREREKQLRKLDQYYDEEKDSEGFILMRVKSFIENPDGGDYPSNKEGASACNYFKYYMDLQQDMDQSEVIYIAQDITPESVLDFKQNMETLDSYKEELEPGINVDEFDNNYGICEQHLDFLLMKKASIGTETHFNIDTTLHAFAEGYSKDVQVTRGKSTASYVALAPVRGAPEHKELNAAMRYLHNVTYHLNTYINHWEDGKLGVNNGRYSKYDGLINFKSLRNVSNNANSKLLYLGAYLVQVFLNAPELHTEQILDTILEQQHQNGLPSAYMTSSRLSLIPSVTPWGDMAEDERTASKNLANVKKFLEKELYKGIGYPDGTHITINTISTESATETVEADVMDDLMESFAYLGIEGEAEEVVLNSRPDQGEYEGDDGSDQGEYESDYGSDQGEYESDYGSDQGEYEGDDGSDQGEYEGDDGSDYGGDYYQWQYETGSGWNNFEWDDNETIQRAYINNSNGSIWLPTEHGNYDINFEHMTQTNNESGTVRAIQWYLESNASGNKRRKSKRRKSKRRKSKRLKSKRRKSKRRKSKRLKSKRRKSRYHPRKSKRRKSRYHPRKSKRRKSRYHPRKSKCRKAKTRKHRARK